MEDTGSFFNIMYSVKAYFYSSIVGGIVFSALLLYVLLGNLYPSVRDVYAYRLYGKLVIIASIISEVIIYWTMPTLSNTLKYVILGIMTLVVVMTLQYLVYAITIFFYRYFSTGNLNVAVAAYHYIKIEGEVKNALTVPVALGVRKMNGKIILDFSKSEIKTEKAIDDLNIIGGKGYSKIIRYAYVPGSKHKHNGCEMAWYSGEALKDAEMPSEILATKGFSF